MKWYGMHDTHHFTQCHLSSAIIIACNDILRVYTIHFCENNHTEEIFDKSSTVTELNILYIRQENIFLK